MKILLDTHTFLWGITDESRVPSRVRTLIQSAEPWLSVASLWEILTKVQLGKLPLPKPVGPYLISKLSFNGIQVLPITLHHVLRVESMELHHRDPFDRMLIAQSMEEGWPIVSADPWFRRYPIEVIW
jgi:PIN domain nuclease of toxin-antitoxin system